MYESIIFTNDAPIATIRLNRPDKLNAFAGPMRDELLDAIQTITGDDRIRVLIITGEGRGFCAGGDIGLLKQLREAKDEPGFRALLANGQRVVRQLHGLGKPVLAAVNGPCAGAGFSLALGCDVRVASERASFIASFASIGLHPDWGGSWLLPKLVGSAKACELVFTAGTVSAEEAGKIGLVNRVVAHDELLPAVQELAGRMAAKSPGVLRAAKVSIYRSLSSDLETAFARETEVQMERFHSEDFLEGINAFLQKRPPEFTGR